jgi:hypothetical protein
MVAKYMHSNDPVYILKIAMRKGGYLMACLLQHYDTG